MKKSENQKMVQSYHDYAKMQNPRVKSQRGVSSGTYGRDFEMQVKHALGLFNFNGIASANSIDTIVKTKSGERVKIEIKSRQGTIGTYDENGNLKSKTLQSDLIIYAPDYKSGDNVLKSAFVMGSKEFVNGLADNGLLIQTTNTQGYPVLKIRPLNSNKAVNALWDLCEEIGIDLDKWIKENR